MTEINDYWFWERNPAPSPSTHTKKFWFYKGHLVFDLGFVTLTMWQNFPLYLGCFHELSTLIYSKSKYICHFFIYKPVLAKCLLCDCSIFSLHWSQVYLALQPCDACHGTLPILLLIFTLEKFQMMNKCISDF